VFIALGVVPLLLAVYKMWRNPRRLTEEVGAMTFEDAIEAAAAKTEKAL